MGCAIVRSKNPLKHNVESQKYEDEKIIVNEDHSIKNISKNILSKQQSKELNGNRVVKSITILNKFSGFKNKSLISKDARIPKYHISSTSLKQL